MIGVVITIHVIVCALLITLILIQRGRGGGLAETFSGVESMFGTKTSALLTRSTTVLSIIFFITCLSLAFLSVQRSRSLMRNVKPQVLSAEQQQPAQPEPQAEEAAPQPAEDASKPQ